jgi:hypothetical protein
MGSPAQAGPPAPVHLHDRRTLEQLAGFGVTTALDMACAPPERVDSLRGAAGLTDIRSAGTPTIAPGSLHARIPVTGQRGLISRADQAGQFVADRVAEPPRTCPPATSGSPTAA